MKNMFPYAMCIQNKLKFRQERDSQAVIFLFSPICMKVEKGFR